MKRLFPAAMIAIALCLALSACGASNAERPAPDAAQAIKGESPAPESPAPSEAVAPAPGEAMRVGSMDKITAFFDQKSWKYEIVKERDGTEALRTRFGIDGKMQVILFQVRLLENGIKIIGASKFNASESTRVMVSEYLTRANYGLIKGNFELDMRDGEVRYKIFLPKYDDSGIPVSAIDAAISTTLGMFHRYGDGLAALMEGASSPENEINKAESDL